MKETQEKMINDFIHTLDNLNAVMAGVPEAGLDWRENKDEWSIRQIIHHLTDDGNVYTFIVERALATPDCKVFLGGFPGNETWANRLAYDQRPVELAIKLMRGQRAFLAELLRNFPDRWENKVRYHNESGELIAERSVREMITMLTEHLLEHVGMLQNILPANKK